MSSMFSKVDRLEKTQNRASGIEKRGLMDALEASQSLVWFDGNGMVVDANDNALKLFAYSEDDILKEDYYTLCKDGSAQKMADRREWAQIAEGALSHTERSYKTRDGAEIWASVNFAAIKTESGRTRRVMAIFIDMNKFAWKPDDHSWMR
ncbi:MAG: PAS domain-containing protein [Paracoccaceae bacterium]